jgi:tetratricopeptide (TPR) repeat protein
MLYEWRMSVTRSKRAFVGCVVLITALAAANTARAAASFSARGYQACVAKIAVKADDALEDALYWRDHGGGLPAQHCAALAMLALNQPAQAALALDQIAHDPEAGAVASRADLLDQSGNAWLLAHQGANADAAFSAALRLTPRDPDVWTDRARARAMIRNWAGAESDLTAALTFVRTPQIYVLRAAARHALNRMKDARADIDWALALDPRDADALVERGSMKLIGGDKAGARADWLQVLVIAPNGPAGDEARRRIEDLEINPNR